MNKLHRLRAVHLVPHEARRLFNQVSAVLEAILEVGLVALRHRDSIRDDDAEGRIRHVVSQSGAKPTIASVTTLVDRRLVGDDITMVLVRRL